MTERSVVLPQPEGPTINVIWPAYTSQSMPRNAWTRCSPQPKCLVSPRIRTATVRPPSCLLDATRQIGGRLSPA